MPKRKSFQIKPIRKGQQSRRGVPELYDEIKEPVSYGITKTARRGIKSQAESLGVSASQFIENIGRGELKVISPPPSALIQEPILMETGRE
ncbi:hypothetical protein [Leptolyngbya sp. KIOST-1]|uniref:hypothetical protein n=1 Tax=Leptolyngbya sp. KIOST-1 TaxID=1229172 RepID=UPI0012E0C41B|nr:hypothetical protein [Leptolyngbya sp. KIOST-1]